MEDMTGKVPRDFVLAHRTDGITLLSGVADMDGDWIFHVHRASDGSVFVALDASSYDTPIVLKLSEKEVHLLRRVLRTSVKRD